LDAKRQGKDKIDSLPAIKKASTAANARSQALPEPKAGVDCRQSAANVCEHDNRCIDLQRKPQRRCMAVDLSTMTQ
jgi:hypothetical protein